MCVVSKGGLENLPPIMRTIRNAKKSKYGDMNDTVIGATVANHSVMLLLKISSMCILKPLATLAEPAIMSFHVS